MIKQYYCEMDNSVFSTEEELINHIKSNYVQVFEGKKDDVSELLSNLQKEFPNYDIDIKECQGYYAEYIVSLYKDGSSIDQYYGNQDGEYNHCPDESNPSTYDELVKEIYIKINTIAEILNTVKDKYLFYEFKFLNYRYGYSDDEHSYNFKFKIYEDSEEDVELFYPYETTTDDFINEFRKYFETVLEGEPDIYYGNGYFSDYLIDGVKIGEMMRNKKVRLQIIE